MEWFKNIKTKQKAYVAWLYWQNEELKLTPLNMLLQKMETW